MQQHKNFIMMLISLILLTYALLLSVYPSILTSSFNRERFEEKVYNAVGLVTSVDDVNFRIRPDLTLIITIRNWSSKYIDNQDCFDAAFIELQTGFLSPLTKNFKIKNLYLRHVDFSNQTLPEGENKLAYISSSFEASAFNTKEVSITPGPVKVRNFMIKNIAPDFYSENKRQEVVYTADEVRQFLNDWHVRHVKIK